MPNRGIGTPRHRRPRSDYTERWDADDPSPKPATQTEYADGRSEAPVKVQSRIDAPRGLDRIPPGPFVIGGVAWAQTIGIDAVEIQIDGGQWMPVELAGEVNDTTWRQWSVPWEATPGRHSLTVRATDRNGAIQTSERSEPLPNGATGHHTVVVLVDES